MTLSTMLKRPSAFVPVLMSLAAIATLLVALARHALVRQADEGAYAHLWQLLMAGQLPFMGYFAIRWLPEAPRQALSVLALQVAVAIAALAPVCLLGL